MKNEQKVYWHQLFEVVEDLDRNGKTIYRLKRKSDGQLINKEYMSTCKDTCQHYAERWVKKNKDKALDMLFEIEVLNDNLQR